MAQRFQLFGWGSNVDTPAQVDPTHDALRASLRPYETQPDPQGIAGGHYSVGAQSGTFAAAIADGARVFQVRWADPTRIFILKKLKVQAITATGFAATSIGCPLQLWLGHGSTANGSGGTALAVSGNKGRATMSATAFLTSGEIRIGTTAGLTAATGETLEAIALGGCAGAPATTNTASPEMFLWDTRDAGEHPIVLLPGDTLAVLTKTPAATGTAVFVFQMSWAETSAF